MKIRELTIKDFEQFNLLMLGVHDYHVKNRPDIYNKIEKLDSSKVWDLEALLQNKNYVLLGAEFDGDLVGICTMAIREPSKNYCIVPRIRGYIEVVCVRKDHRRRGIATALYNEAVQCARQFGADSVELMVWDFNKPALEFYKSLGMTVQSCIMEKKL